MRETSLWGILMTWLISKYQEFITFLGSISCSGQELLSWLNNRAALGVGFNRTVFIGDFNVLFVKYWGRQILACQVAKW